MSSVRGQVRNIPLSLQRTWTMSTFEDRVIKTIRHRQQQGLKKYGIGVERTDLDVLEWLQHLQEELLDAAIYIERIKFEAGAMISKESDGKE